jgi:hypothetical protein
LAAAAFRWEAAAVLFFTIWCFPKPLSRRTPSSLIFVECKSVALNLIKLCVGADSIEDLADWQKKRAAERKKKGGAGDVLHITRMTPKRADELLLGGSLYWVIKGQIAVRQRLVALRPVVREGVPHCALVLDTKLVPTVRRTHRAFQGWRYFDSKDAPRDLKASDKSKLPDTLRAELTQLGLL